MRSMQWQLGILGTISAFAYRHRETKKNLCRGGKFCCVVTQAKVCGWDGGGVGGGSEIYCANGIMFFPYMLQ